MRQYNAVKGIKTYDDWCKKYGISHGHCPYGCEHPQPFVRDEKLYCGRCWFKDGILTEIEICECD